MLHNARRRLPAALAIALALALTVACDPLTQGDVEQQGWHNFQTAVASQRTYDIYWLGREFDAGGISFRGPDAGNPGPGDIDSVAGGGLAMSYSGRTGSLDVTLYSRGAWDLLQASRARGAQPHLEVKNVDIHGWPAQLRTNYYRPGYIAARILTVDRGNTVIEVTTGPLVPATPGPEPNPLIDEQTFLNVLQHLRPYPQ
jgi:hypothetical protein